MQYNCLFFDGFNSNREHYISRCLFISLGPELDPELDPLAVLF